MNFDVKDVYGGRTVENITFFLSQIFLVRNFKNSFYAFSSRSKNFKSHCSPSDDLHFTFLAPLYTTEVYYTAVNGKKNVYSL